MSDEREAVIEAALTDLVAVLGGLCIKLNPFWYVGIPDRLVLLPRARIGFIELKRPVGGRRGKMQEWWRNKLRELGFKCEFVNTKQKVSEFLASL